MGQWLRFRTKEGRKRHWKELRVGKKLLNVFPVTLRIKRLASEKKTRLPSTIQEAKTVSLDDNVQNEAL